LQLEHTISKYFHPSDFLGVLLIKESNQIYSSINENSNECYIRVTWLFTHMNTC